MGFFTKTNVNKGNVNKGNVNKGNAKNVNVNASNTGKGNQHDTANGESANAADGLISVSTEHLIGLRHVAQSLPLKITKVRALQSGQYYSPFRGRGMEFDEVRLYQPGDDVRSLDWRVTARRGEPHTKLFREERERAVLVWVDFRLPMFFATRGAFKSVIAAKTAALLAWSAHHQRDRIGGLLFSEHHHLELRPKNGKSAVLHLLQSLAKMSQFHLNDTLGQSALAQSPPLTASSSTSQSDACYQALARLRRVSKPGSLLILISDFRGIDEQSESLLTQLSRHNDVVMLSVHDPLEKTLPPAGFYRLTDQQNSLAIDTSDLKVRQQYQARFDQHMDYLKNMSKRHHIHFTSLSTEENLVEALQRKIFIK